MLDVTARDGPARGSTWETPQGEVRLPAVAQIDTDRHPAPDHARLLLRKDEPGEIPTIVHRGTLFTPSPEAEEDEQGLAIPRGLVYPDEVGISLKRAADEATPQSAVRIVHAVEDLTPHDGLVILPGARGVAGDPWRLAGFLVQARERAGPNAVLFTPGIGRPDQIALAAHAGVDAFDGLEAVFAALEDRYLTPEGPLPADTVTEPPCACPACRQADEEGFTRQRLEAHNRWALEAEVRRVRHAIEQGSLRELVETRARTSPAHVATLRRFDLDHAGFFEERAPSVRERELPVLSERSLTRPEVARWPARLEGRYRPPASASVLVALPCAATKPYQESPTHRAIRPAIENRAHGRAHVVTLTSPLGAVPEELELAYPAAHYDVPVTGDWSSQETELIQRAYQAIWKAGDYDQAILHLDPDEADIVEPVLPQAVRTVELGERATSSAATERLGEAVSDAVAGLEPTARTDLFEEHMDVRIDWQFGPGTHEVLAEDTEIRGRFPFLKLMHGDTQLLMLKPERGALTLTLDGGRRLLEATDAFTVEIDDFHPKGTVFGPGVLDAADGIRVEDEVVVVHDGELRAVGRAAAPGPQMAAMEHGACVEVRHHA